MELKSLIIRAQQPIDRVKKPPVFIKKWTPETIKKSPLGRGKPLHSALNRVKFMEFEWKKVVVVKTDSKNLVDVRVLAATFDDMKV